MSTGRRAAPSSDERFMDRALALAARGRGTTRPNPMVGAVIVRDGRVLAQGYHRRAGDAHAEVVALQALARAGGDARGATLYVNLEPCCHVGRTGPCTDAIVAAGFARVVVACLDVNPRVNGAGIAALRRVGVKVDVGCRQAEAEQLNRAFFAWIAQGRPLVTLKAAVTLDGYIADRRPRRRRGPVWITGPEARRAAHALRAEHDAVLVGAETVAADDPLLTVRLDDGADAAPQPLRVVLDGKLRTSPRAQVLKPTEQGARTLVLGAAGAAPSRKKALEATGAAVVLLPARRGRIAVPRLLRRLAQDGVQSLLVEGGAEVLGEFVDAGLADRVAFFVAPILLGGGGRAVTAGLGRSIARGLRLGPIAAHPVGGDLLLTADVLAPAR